MGFTPTPSCDDVGVCTHLFLINACVELHAASILTSRRETDDARTVQQLHQVLRGLVMATLRKTHAADARCVAELNGPQGL